MVSKGRCGMNRKQGQPPERKRGHPVRRDLGVRSIEGFPAPFYRDHFFPTLTRKSLYLYWKIDSQCFLSMIGE
jgi:hypothetical protein